MKANKERRQIIERDGLQVRLSMVDAELEVNTRRLKLATRNPFMSDMQEKHAAKIEGLLELKEQLQIERDGSVAKVKG